MAVTQEDHSWVGGEIGQVGRTQFFQGPHEVLGCAGGVRGIPVGFKLMGPEHDIEQDGQQGAEWRVEKGKEDEACIDG